MPRPQPFPRASTFEPREPDPVAQDLTEEELEAHIRSMRDFLSRYPSRRDTADTPDEAAPAAATAAPAASPTGPTLVEPASVEPTPVEPTSVESLLRDASPSHVDAGAEEVAQAELASDDLGQDSRSSRIYWWWVAGAAVTLVAALVSLAIAGSPFRASSPAQGAGTLVVETNPPGLPVLIDGGSPLPAPVTVSLPTGRHVVEVVYGAERRRLPVTIASGSHVSQFVELPAAMPALGGLEIRTNPAGASIAVDGRPVGRSPLTVPQLTPGSHTVVLQLDTTSLTERVTVDAGRTTSLVVPMRSADSAPAPVAAAASGGWLTVTAPADVQVLEGGRLLGTSRIDRIMLPVGRHELELVNEPLGYREQRTVSVSAGQVSIVAAVWPTGSVALNAAPWADVFVDGQRVGETPIGRLAVPIGPHDIVFRHPELGERRATVTVRVGQAARVAVDMKAP